jgi:hypothetical protein
MGINRVVTSNTQGNPTDTIYGGGIGDDGNASTDHVPIAVGTTITATDVATEQQNLNNIIQNTQMQNTIAQQANNSVITNPTVSDTPRPVGGKKIPNNVVLKDTNTPVAPKSVVNKDYTIYYAVGILAIAGIATYLILKK